MRIKFMCIIDNKTPLLKFNYGSRLRNLIYDIIGEYNGVLSTKLHNNKEIKRLLISDIRFEKFDVNSNGIIPLSNKISFIVSSSEVEIIEALLNSKMKHIRKLSDNFYFKIENVKTEKISYESNKIFITNKQNPILISINENNKVRYIYPTHKDYKRLFFSNLIKKANQPQLLKDIDSYNLEIVSDIVHKMIGIKHGYLYKFKLNCPDILIKHGMLDGFGINNCEGFGFIK